MRVALLTITLAGMAALLGAGPASALSPPCYDCGGNAAHRTYTHVVTAGHEPRYVGWADLRLSFPGNAAPGYGDTFQTWRWNGRAWSSVTLAKGQVYVYPYTSGWSWIWRSNTGWLATRSSNVIIRTVQRPCTQPPAAGDVGDWSYSSSCLGAMY